MSSKVVNFSDYRARRICWLMQRYGLDPEKADILYWNEKYPTVYAKYGTRWLNVEKLMSAPYVGPEVEPNGEEFEEG